MNFSQRETMSFVKPPLPLGGVFPPPIGLSMVFMAVLLILFRPPTPLPE